MSEAERMYHTDRSDAYERQRGTHLMTPRQQRRWMKKLKAAYAPREEGTPSRADAIGHRRQYRRARELSKAAGRG